MNSANRPQLNTSPDTDRGSTSAHQALVTNILLAFGARPGLRLWKNATGRARAFNSDRVISFGLPGSPDIIGVGPGGRFIGIEVKTGNAKQTDEQKAFMKTINALGGMVFVARNLNDVEDAIKNV